LTQEIERKFLVKHLPADVEKFPRTYIKQCYLIIGNNDEVRIREKRKGEKQSYTLTIKSGNGAVRGEYETAITQEQYEKLKVLQKGNAIKKYRINIPQGERTIELDIYLDELSGNSTAEVEFPSEEIMQ
jgi:CYTH domain-containing protein